MNKKQNAFTLIELLVVMALIGVLASIVMVSLTGTIEKARMAKVLKFSQGIQNALGADIVLNLSFDDQANPTKDASGYENNGTVNVTVPGDFTSDTPHKFLGVGPAQGKYALYIDGNDYVDCGNNPSLNINNDFTIEAWIKLTAGQTGGVVNWGEQVAGKRRSMLIWNGGIGPNWYLYFFGYGTPANVGGTSNLNDGKWHHAVVTVDSNNHGKVYVDSVLENEKDLTLVSYTFSGTRIGRTDVPEYFNGIIDEVRIYNRALTAFEIQKHYVERASRHGIVLK